MHEYFKDISFHLDSEYDYTILIEIRHRRKEFIRIGKLARKIGLWWNSNFEYYSKNRLYLVEFYLGNS